MKTNWKIETAKAVANVYISGGNEIIGSVNIVRGKFTFIPSWDAGPNLPGKFVTETPEEMKIILAEKGLRVETANIIKNSADLERHYNTFAKQNKKIQNKMINAEPDESLHGRILHHGTREKNLNFNNDRFPYLTDSPKEAQAYARGVHLGGTGSDKPHVKHFIHANTDKVYDINKHITRAFKNDSNVEDVINNVGKAAKKKGYHYLTYQHPSFTDEKDHNVFVSLFPKDDLKHVGNSYGSETANIKPDAIIQNGTINQLKNVAKNSQEGEARFVIGNNKLTIGDAAYHYHDRMVAPEHQHTVGFVEHHPNDNTYFYQAGPPGHKDPDSELHPLVSKFKKFKMQPHPFYMKETSAETSVKDHLLNKGWDHNEKDKSWIHSQSKNQLKRTESTTHLHHYTVTHKNGEVTRHKTNSDEMLKKHISKLSQKPDNSYISNTLNAKKGSLHEHLGIPHGQTIPLGKLEKLANSDHPLAGRARLVLIVYQAQSNIRS
jgi:hypothetical protein